MTPDCSQRRLLLVPSLRGALSPKAQAELDDHLVECPACASLLASERALDQLLDTRLPRYPAPPSLPRSLARTWPRGSPVTARPRPPRWFLAAAAVLVLGLSSALVFNGARRGERGLAAEAVTEHLQLLDGAALSQVTGGLHEVKPWFNGKLDFAPRLRFAGDADFPLQGGAVEPFLGHPAAVFVFTRRLHRASLFVLEDDAHAFPSGQQTQVVRGFNVVLWKLGTQGFALVSDLNLQELLELQSRIARGDP